MKILITGARGFIGRHLVSGLSQCCDAQIFALDIKGENKKENLCESLSADMAIPGWTEIIPGSMDVVVHLAQSLRYRDFPEGADDMVRININATFELLEWCRKNYVKKFIFSSTGNVYRPSKNLLGEDHPCEPATMYAATKLSAEHLAAQYRSFFYVQILRLFGVYGPGQTGMTISNVIERIRTGEEITLAQGAGLYFTPLYITDCVMMILKLLNLDDSCLFNLSGNERINLGQVVKIAELALNRQANINLTDNSPAYLQGNNSKICQALQVRPMIPFDEGMMQTILAYKEKVP